MGVREGRGPQPHQVERRAHDHRRHARTDQGPHPGRRARRQPRRRAPAQTVAAPHPDRLARSGQAVQRLCRPRSRSQPATPGQDDARRAGHRRQQSRRAGWQLGDDRFRVSPGAGGGKSGGQRTGDRRQPLATRPPGRSGQDAMVRADGAGARCLRGPPDGQAVARRRPRHDRNRHSLARRGQPLQQRVGLPGVDPSELLDVCAARDAQGRHQKRPSRHHARQCRDARRSGRRPCASRLGDVQRPGVRPLCPGDQTRGVRARDGRRTGGQPELVRSGEARRCAPHLGQHRRPDGRTVQRQLLLVADAHRRPAPGLPVPVVGLRRRAPGPRRHA